MTEIYFCNHYEKEYCIGLSPLTNDEPI